jgi:hypothetical protein
LFGAAARADNRLADLRAGILSLVAHGTSGKRTREFGEAVEVYKTVHEHTMTAVILQVARR